MHLLSLASIEAMSHDLALDFQYFIFPFPYFIIHPTFSSFINSFFIIFLYLIMLALIILI